MCFVWLSWCVRNLSETLIKNPSNLIDRIRHFALGISLVFVMMIVRVMHTGVKLFSKLAFVKSENLQYNTIVRWVAGSIISSTKCLKVQVLFWLIENKTVGCWFGLRAVKTLYFCKVIERWNNKLKGFLQIILQEIMKKNYTWNIRCLVDETILPTTQHIILKIVGFYF